MSLFDKLNKESHTRGLEFVVIGGLAVNVHGVPRDTADLDLLVRQESRSDWLKLFSEWGYSVVQERPAFCQLDPPRSGAWPVDLMFVRKPTFRQIFNSALEVEMFGQRLRIPTVEHLLALKLHALKYGHVGRYLKDYLDIEGLLRANKLDPRQPKIRDLFLKYGNLDVYEKVCQTLTGQ